LHGGQTRARSTNTTGYWRRPDQERSADAWGNVGSNQGAREPEQVTSIDVDLLDHLRPLAGGEVIREYLATAYAPCHPLGWLDRQWRQPRRDHDDQPG
jgi:hypothetical protein